MYQQKSTGLFSSEMCSRDAATLTFFALETIFSLGDFNIHYLILNQDLKFFSVSEKYFLNIYVFPTQISLFESFQAQGTMALPFSVSYVYLLPKSLNRNVLCVTFCLKR